MLKATASSAVSFPGTLWFPGKKPEGFAVAPLSERAIAIAKSREELLGLLHDVPESDHELSLTDLVEKGSAADGPVPSETTRPPDGDPNRMSDVRERRMRRNSRTSRSSSNEGVLLNMYMPMSFTRSHTVSHSSRGSGHGATVDCNKRERESTSFGCLSSIWNRGRRKSRINFKEQDEG